MLSNRVVTSKDSHWERLRKLCMCSLSNRTFPKVTADTVMYHAAFRCAGSLER
ncbi:hypothetical protein BIW11_12872 [Tropilaelaps mercedesae]|uniref:Uncharacterized protein n=1 Tax=Tropilaelaps mercedesae TaxID=418985 RepID=A0A1V9X4U2_9ACAR|nr:hypothetical protein BIW11_12872 [Tropilaelaps mercedesae]